MSSRVLLLGAAAVAVVAVGVFLILNFTGKVYGQVGNYKVTESSLNRVKTELIPTTKRQVVETMLDNHMYAAMAKDNKISVSKSEVDQKLSERSLKPSSIKSNSYLRLAAERDVYKEKLEQGLKGYYKGQFVIARFDQHIFVKGGSISREQAKLTPQQITVLQKQDRDYATTFINQINSDLKSGKITFTEAVQKQLDDPKFGIKSSPTILQSGSFNTANETAPGRELFSQSQIRTVLASLKTGKVSAPVLGKVETGVKKDAPKVDGMWLMFKLSESRAKIQNYPSFDVMESSYKAKLGYRLSV